MKVRPIKIVFTGGPCAGKTTQINKIKCYLENNGYKVIVIPETATELIKSGIDFKFINSLVEFQDIILKYQYFKESTSESIVNNKGDNIVLLYDRALLDNKSYFDNYRDFDYIMNNISKSEIEVLDSYDMVLDLLSLATCNPKLYELGSNIARSETPEEARALDKKTSASWVGHADLSIIRSDVSIDEEFAIIKNKIDEKLKGEQNKDKKQIIIDNKLEDFKVYDDNNSRLMQVESLKLQVASNLYLELLKRTYKNKTSILAILQDDNKIYSKEPINFDTYLELINRYKIESTEKYNCLSFVYNQNLFDIKFYDEKTILEYKEKTDNKNIEFPSEIKLGKQKKLSR